MIDGTAVATIAKLAQEAAVVTREKIGTYEFTDRKLERIDLDAKLPPALEFYTLQGFVDYVEREPEAKDALIHVVSPALVLATGRLEGQDKDRRRTFAKAVFRPSPTDGFEFNSYGSLEDLNIALQTMFDENRGEVTDLRKFTSAIRQSSSVGLADDGVSQSVEAKRGVAAVLPTAVKNPWALAMYRTFAEVEQPLSYYVLRFRGYEGQLPQAALYETFDARWQVKAVETIAKWLRVKMASHQILG